MSCDEVCGIPSYCCNFTICPACGAVPCHSFDPGLDPHGGIQHAGFFLVLSCAGLIKCHKSSTVVAEQYSTQFWQYGFPYARFTVIWCVTLRGGSFAPVHYCFRYVMASSAVSFARKGFRVIMSTCGCRNLACPQHILSAALWSTPKPGFPDA